MNTVSDESLLSTLVENEILRQYGSLRKFTEKFGWSYTTIYSGLKRGIGGMGINVFSKLCKDLNIDLNALLEENIVKPADLSKKEIDPKIKMKILELTADELITLDKFLNFIFSARGN